MEEIDAAAPLAMHELVTLGTERIPAEVVAIRGSRRPLQAYEYTGGLGPGAGVVALGRPLSASLGPGLLGVCSTGCCARCTPRRPG